MPENIKQAFTHIGHDDHGITDEQIQFAMTHPVFEEIEDGSFTIQVLTLPEELGTVISALYGPAAGDEPIGEDKVFYETRGNRKRPSRLISNEGRPAKNLVVIGIKGGPCFTMYGTQADTPSPKEPWDAENWEEFSGCLDFWNQHCLAEPNPDVSDFKDYDSASEQTRAVLYRCPVKMGATVPYEG